MLKNNKGITLAALVITIIVLIILASVATVSGKDAINYVKFNNAKAQFQTMQAQADAWYEESKNNSNVLNYGLDLSKCDATKREQTLNGRDSTGYRYFKADYIKNTFDIDGISYDFLINVSNGTVLLYGGITYKDKTYYSAEDFGINSVEYNKLQSDITFDTIVENDNIIVYNIRFVEDIDISKYDVQYQKDGETYWTTLTLDHKRQYEYTTAEGTTKTDENAWYIPVSSEDIDVDFDPDYIPYIDGENIDVEVGNINVKIATKSDKVVSKIAKVVLTRTVSYGSYVGVVMTSTTKLRDRNQDIIIVPENFNISKESPIKVTEGIIIEDSEKNQYVWIPVFEKTESRDWGVDYTTVKTKTEDSDQYYTAIETALKKYTNPDIDNGKYTYGSKTLLDVWYGDASYGIYGYYEEDDTEQTNLIYYTNGNMSKTEYETLYHNMLKSVYTNGGFYIGRYEMGIEVVNSIAEAEKVARKEVSEYTQTYKNSNNTAPSIEGMTAPISKVNAVPYYHITQSQAQMLAKSLNYSNVTSSLMFGVQWDAVCVFIEKFDTNNTYNTKSTWLKGSKAWGNYYSSETYTYTMDRGFYMSVDANMKYWGWKTKGTLSKYCRWLCTTGASDRNSSLNIYDFAGNLSEYTLERVSGTTSLPCAGRGGSFYSGYYASESQCTSTYIVNYSNNAFNASHSFGARTSLYINF